MTGVATGKTIGTVTIKAAAAVAGGTDVSNQTTLTVKSHEASIAITLGEENFSVATPAAGYYTSVANAPRTVISDITKVKVNVTPAAHASVKIGSRVFISGYPLDFTSPVTFTVTAQDGTAKNYTLAIAAYDATANPYGIYTVKHLIDMAGNDVNNRGARLSFLLKNNIDLPDRTAAEAAAITGMSDYAAAGWKPLAHNLYGYGFRGTFDGGNFSINNFYINRETTDEIGLFAKLETEGTIKNLGINGASGTAVTGKQGGFFVFYCQGTIDKCYAAGNISVDYSGGGLVAYLESGGVISNSYATGNISGSSASSNIGGLAGRVNEGAINNSYATGNIVVSYSSAAPSVAAGGLAGRVNKGTISNSYATGNVSVPLSSSAGGLAGSSNSANVTYTNCYRNSDAAIKNNNVDVAPNDASIAGIVAKTKDYMQTDAFKADLNGPAGTIWGREDSRNDKLPYIAGVGR
ncbi:MAG: hypothetical protein CRN43_21410 [Candidatus Nephrothrix sp. EaCA]|nr:MAG: hypothetical protein CRN43_21410 [Candidatus Nephrothrix sp. EaCA]